ncbi:MAG: radical SAM-associated putative lipoprotein [Spirochaetaceae bacterium]|nr:radical SAM-associated putative lipoprotein [Spirochaetaceae bacterium]
MRIARRIASIILKVIATGAFSLFLAACYGVMAAMYGVPTRNGTIRVKDSTTKAPIPGIRVSFKSWVSPQSEGMAQWEPYPVLSDGNGKIDYEYGYVNATLDAKVEDIDGTANGSYAPRTATINDGDEVFELDPAAAR